MSGGVDSSVAAYLLKKANHDITGVTMRHYNFSEQGFSEKTGIEADIADARAVCKKLEIDHQVIDVQKEFKQSVINYFIKEYTQGRTPNPCTYCNPRIKWGIFLDKIKQQGFEKIATGHYTIIRKKGNNYLLSRGKDMDKDQSYMLWGLSQSQLTYTIFPIGSLLKDEVIKLAKKLCIPAHDKQESQEVCFIPSHYEKFFRKNINLVPGDILFKDGKKIGQHKGLQLYTIGQRRGLNTPWHSPLYVMKIDVGTNSLHVTDDDNDLFKDTFTVQCLNWISPLPEDPSLIKVQTRYNSIPVRIKSLQIIEKEIKVILKNKTRAITPGQSAVFYLDDLLLGGGIIKQ